MSSQTIGHWETKSLFYFSLRMGDNPSACPVWAHILFLMSLPPHLGSFFSVLTHLFLLQPASFVQKHSCFLKSRVFIQERSEGESAACCSLVLLAVAGEELCFEGAAGLLTARCHNSCKGKESRHTGALGKSCAVLGKKLAAECFSKF